MSVLIALAALALLMLAAYRGYSVILFAPIAALGAVLLTDPGAVGPTFTGLFMEKMVGFVKLYFPVFLLGAVFGKLIELSGFSRAIVAAAIQILGRRHAIPVIVLVCAMGHVLSKVAVKDVTDFRDALLDHFEQEHSDLCRSLEDEKVLTDDMKQEILRIAEKYLAANAERFRKE